jgi:hypothetical protein
VGEEEREEKDKKNKMSRTPQPAGKRGSLKWIQRCVNHHGGVIDAPILERLDGAGSISWLSPLIADDFAEYRDADFLNLLGLSRLAPQLKEFWPNRGPQWDALGVSDKGDILLVEAKAHIGELHSPPSAAGEKSARIIGAALLETATAFGVAAQTKWGANFYQLANRLAHLHFLRKHGVPAWLVLVNFTGDDDMCGPLDAAGWDGAYEDAHRALGITRDMPMLRHVMHVCPDVRLLA